MYTSVSGTGTSLADRCGGSKLFLFMSLIETIFRAQSDINGTNCDPPTIESPDAEYDFIVVGAGSAGCVVAARLTENPLHRVLLIEAGGPEPLGSQVAAFYGLYPLSPIDWQFATQSNGQSHLSSPGQRSTWSAGKVLGGTSTLNFMMYVRGNPADFDRWSALGNRGWDYESVLPYFRRSECNADFRDRFHGCDGPLPVERGYQPLLNDEFERAAREFGLPVLNDINGARQSGFVRGQSTRRNGVRFSTARAYLDEAWDRRNLDVWLRTVVSRVLLEEQEDGVMRAVGVETIDQHQVKRTVRARKEVIVSAGTVGSPKVLLLSGIGGPEELKKVGVQPLVELPGVGRNLQDHMGLVNTYNLQRPSPNELNVNVDTVNEYLQSRTGVLSLSGGTTFIKYASRYADGDHDPDCQLFLLATPQKCSRTGAVDEQMQPTQTIRTLASLLRTKSRGHVRLASADPFAPPLVYPNQLSHPDDVERMLEPIEMVQRLMLETSVFRPFNVTLVPGVDTPCKRLGIGTPSYWRCELRHRTQNMHHQVGTCRMGPRDDVGRLTVVDGELRVHGVRDLRVIDASVMPEIVSGNPNAATIMIGEKGVEAVRNRWEKFV